LLHQFADAGYLAMMLVEAVFGVGCRHGVGSFTCGLPWLDYLTPPRLP
jgi:hypothetical protein